MFLIDKTKYTIGNITQDDLATRLKQFEAYLDQIEKELEAHKELVALYKVRTNALEKMLDLRTKQLEHCLSSYSCYPEVLEGFNKELDNLIKLSEKE